MPEDPEIDDVQRQLSDPLLDEIQFNGVSIGETWRVQTAIEEFIQKDAQLVGIDDEKLKYTIGDRTGTRSVFLQLSDRSLLSPELIVGIQAEVLRTWPEWTVALVGYSREGDVALISARSVSVGSENVDDIASFMQKFADEEMIEHERLFGPLERQKQYVEFQLKRKVTITDDQPFQIVAIFEHWRQPRKYLGVWVNSESDVDKVAISVFWDESICDGTRYAVSPTGKLLDYLVSQDDGKTVRESTLWINQWLIPRDYQGLHLSVQGDSDSRQWTIQFDGSSMLTDTDLQRIRHHEL